MMLESLKGFATSHFGWIVEKYPEFFAVVKENLPKADMKISHRTYASLVIFISLILFFLSFFVSIPLLLFFQTSLLLSIFYSFFTSLLIALVCFLVFIFYPVQKASKRKKDIESNLPFVLTHMSAICETGVPPYMVFKLLSRFKEYGEISREMEKIVKSIEELGTDPLTAVKQVANKTPSERLKQILLGFVTTIEGGGNIKVFLKTAGDEALFEWRIKREKFIQQLSTIAEFYTGILIAAPLFIISLFAVMNMIQPTLMGFGILDIMKISSYLLVPVINIGFLLFLESVEVSL
ncbi:MAG: type II secretion system F family protein [Candidatus Aenigmatarchaeota archaeon]